MVMRLLVVNTKTIIWTSPVKHWVSYHSVHKFTLVVSNPPLGMPLMKQLHYYETSGYLRAHELSDLLETSNNASLAY